MEPSGVVEEPIHIRALGGLWEATRAPCRGCFEKLPNPYSTECGQGTATLLQPHEP